MSKYKVIIFSCMDDRDMGFERAKNLAASLKSEGVNVKFINKQGSDLDGLRQVVRHRIVTTPCVTLINKDGKVVYKEVGIPTLSALHQIIDTTT